MVRCCHLQWGIARVRAYSQPELFRFAPLVPIWHPIYVIYTRKTIYTSSQKTGHKAKICRCHFLPSSIEAGSSNVWQCSQIILPTRTTIQGPFVPALEPVRRKSGAQGELCLRALFTFLLSEKALELFGSAPNIYFLSRAPRPTRMVSWLFVWVRTIELYCLAIEVHLPWRQKNGIWQSYGFILRFLRRNMYNFMCTSNSYRVPYPRIPSTIKQLRLSVPAKAYAPITTVTPP